MPLIFALEHIVEALPADLDLLRSRAATEGFRMLDRLAAEWRTGVHRFDQPGEALLAARMDARLVGIGGMTIDDRYPEALRMRRFYVAYEARRQGIGRALVIALVQRSECRQRRIVVKAGTEAASAFWEALGFIPAEDVPGYTHVLPDGTLDP
jgi:GNAT superfamily N-acetyltransferase